MLPVPSSRPLPLYILFLSHLPILLLPHSVPHFLLHSQDSLFLSLSEEGFFLLLLHDLLIIPIYLPILSFYHSLPFLPFFSFSSSLTHFLFGCLSHSLPFLNTSLPSPIHSTRSSFCLTLYSTLCAFPLYSSINSTSSFTGILNTLLGVPAECMHQSGVWPCKLSFSCWLQGGKHAKGCGSNKWLFSCCIGDPLHQHQHQSPLENLVDYGKLKMGLSSLPKRIMLRRRDDNELLSVKVSTATIEQLH